MLQKSDSQLRSKKYKLKLSEIISVPFGSNTVKDVPEIVFSQEIEPLQGFVLENPNQDAENVTELKKQKEARAKLIESLENEINKERKRGRPLKKKYPETEVLAPDDFLDDSDSEMLSQPKVQSIVETNKKVAPTYGFDYKSWLELLDLEIFLPKARRNENDNNGSDSDEEIKTESDEKHSSSNEDISVNNDTVQHQSPETLQQTLNFLDEQIEDFEMRMLSLKRNQIEDHDSSVLDDVTDEEELEVLEFDNYDDKNDEILDVSQDDDIGEQNDVQESLVLDDLNDDKGSEAPEGDNYIDDGDSEILDEYEENSNDDKESEEVENEDDDEKSDQHDDEVKSNTKTRSTEEDVDHFMLKQSRQPQRNDKLLFFSRDRDSWQIITITSNVNKRFLKHGWYFNFRYLDELEDGSYFHPGKPYWGIVSEDDVVNLDLNGIVPVLDRHPDDSPTTQLDMETVPDPTIASDTIVQMDGAGTPESLTPVNSKEPSPEVSGDTSDQIQDKETENRDDCGEDSSARELRRISRAKHKNELE